MKSLFKWARKYLPHLIVITILMFVLELLYSYLSQFVAFAIALIKDEPTDGFIPNFLENWLVNVKDNIGLNQAVAFTGLSLIIVQFIRSIMRFSTNYLTGDVTQNIGRDMRIKFYDRVTDLSFTYLNRADSGDLIQRCTSDIDTSSGFIGSQMPSLIDTLFTVIIGTVRMALISWQMMLVGALVIPVTIIASILYFRYVTKLIEKVEVKESKMTTDIQEDINGIRVVKAFANEKYEIEKMDKDNLEYCKADFKVNKVMSTYWAISDTVTLLQYFVAVLIGIYLTKSGQITMADMVGCLGLLEMVVWPMRGLGIALFLTSLAKKGCKVSELRKTFPDYQIAKNRIDLTSETDVDAILVKVKEMFAKDPNAQVNDIDGVKIDFPDRWVHLRKSNTEPIIRVYSEAQTMEEADEIGKRLMQVVYDMQ